MRPIAAVAAVLAVLATLALAGCGGGGSGGGGSGGSTAAPPSPSASSSPTLRYANVVVVHETIGGVPQVRLRTVIEGGGTVMTAIGSDADTGETDSLNWTTMRVALLEQLKSAMKALGWQEVGSGPAWWQIRFAGGPNARIPIVADDTRTPVPAPPVTQTPTPTPPVTQTPTPTPSPTGGYNQVGNLVDLIGKGFDDPQVYALISSCGAGDDKHRSGNIVCYNGGFELTLGGAGLTVTTVTLFSAERNGFSEYPGPLPLGLDWTDSYYDIIDKLGSPDAKLGGNGVTVELQYPSDGVWLVLETSATHDWEELLRSSHLLSIYITKYKVYDFSS
jgi:hypothetical protein